VKKTADLFGGFFLVAFKSSTANELHRVTRVKVRDGECSHRSNKMR